MTVIRRAAIALLACMAAFSDEPMGVPTFYGEVGRILASKCIGCHRVGQPGRFPLDTWEQARLFAREIRLAVGMRTMPPWPAVPGFGHFSNDRSLSVAQIETLIRWTDTGTQKGSGTGRLTPSYSDDPATFGKELSPAILYEVPANGDVETRCFSYQGFATNIWVRGINVIPGDRRIVLHVRVFADSDGSAERMDRADPEPGFRCSNDPAGYLKRRRLGDWAPATPLDLTPLDVGRELKAGTSLLVEIRYARLGTPGKDASRVQLLTLPKRPPRLLRTMSIASEALTIPADTWSFRSSTDWIAPAHIRLHALVPYLSDLGTDFKAVVKSSDGAKVPLVWIHDYNVNWQVSYLLDEPMMIRSGSRIEIHTEFDNFETNPRTRRGQSADGRYGLMLEYEEAQSIRERTLSNSP
ncbi:MAG TPA: hypothetical protein VEX68_09010 [Bryobacteraceae bacterium]|nr:hypothetical protein [Bryobacteraceae bacterium]